MPQHQKPKPNEYHLTIVDLSVDCVCVCGGGYALNICACFVLSYWSERSLVCFDSHPTYHFCVKSSLDLWWSRIAQISSNLVFYAQSTIAVISGGTSPRYRRTGWLGVKKQATSTTVRIVACVYVWLSWHLRTGTPYWPPAASLTPGSLWRGAGLGPVVVPAMSARHLRAFSPTSS